MSDLDHIPSGDIEKDASTFSWLLARFVSDTDGVGHAIAVSSDGLLIASSAAIERAPAERLAAVASGITSLADGVSRGFSMGTVNQVIIEMAGGYLFVCAISDGANLAVLATPGCNIGVVAYEMTTFVQRAGGVLSPEVIEILKAVR
jgi:predicted regulator of Ras-like GTPase activity (Roadblock/LC7/MglB family)